MKVLLSWLKDYVDITISPKELEEKLFSCGLEVEELKYLGDNMKNVVVGEIKSLEKYEGTHLQICHMDCGKYGDDIVILTGADNVFVGAKVPVAMVGAVLPNGMEIAPRKMQGMMSYGMLCSGEELGIEEGWYPGAGVHGILILDGETPVAADMVDVLGLNDYLYDISVTANRPDCQSVLGIAREVAAITRKELKNPDLSYTEDGTTKDAIKVSVADKDLCPRYLSHYIYDVEYKEAPQWMKRRLLSCGFRPISAIVDITNYVLLEIGQPMHAFDLSTLDDSTILVRRAKDGEEIVTLDEKSYKLTPNNLVICDSNKAVGLAGVMGGLNSEITENTKEILFESAKFLKDNIRKTGRALGIRTDACARFEKGIDEYSVETGMARALPLVEELGVAKISSTKGDETAGASTEKRKITCSVDKVNAVLGITVPEEEMVSILKALQFEVEVKDHTLELLVPRYREDVETYQDIAEEVIREYGYDKVVPTFLDGAMVTNGGLNKLQSKELRTKEILCGMGFYEIQTIAMYSKKELDLINLPADAPERNVIELLNPITENLSIMRTVMAPSMINVIEDNIKKDNSAARFFEIANVYIPKALPLKEMPIEKKMLCMGAFGKGEDFYQLKAVIETMAKAFGLSFEFVKGSVPYLHPGMTADVMLGGKKIGHLGKVRYDVVEKLNIAEGKKADTNIFLAELDYSALSECFKAEIKYQQPSAYLSVSRDLSVLVDMDVECGRIMKEIKAASEEISEVKLFDIYVSDKLGNNKKSMAFNLTLSSKTEEVTDEKAGAVMDKVVERLAKELGAEMRMA